MNNMGLTYSQHLALWGKVYNLHTMSSLQFTPSLQHQGHEEDMGQTLISTQTCRQPDCSQETLFRSLKRTRCLVSLQPPLYCFV